MHQIVAASDQEVGGLAVILPPLYEIFWSALVLLIVLLLVGRYALPRIYKTMDERAAKIEEGLGAAEQAKADQAAAALKREEIIREAHAEAHTIRERANDEAKAIVAAARHEATSEANRIRGLRASDPRREAGCADFPALRGGSSRLRAGREDHR